MNTTKQVIVCGTFENIQSRHLRFLHEASHLGTLTVLLLPDAPNSNTSANTKKAPIAERQYFLRAVSFVDKVIAVNPGDTVESVLQSQKLSPNIWADLPNPLGAERQAFCSKAGFDYILISPTQLQGYPILPPKPTTAGRKKVVVTGCYDWFHSGHVRFFEEVSAFGDLYVIVGNDSNLCLLKGPGHPLFPQDERCYMCSTIRHVTQALISTGSGWLDADPEINKIKPDIYAVNEDGDKGGKREYCERLGIEYLVLKRAPAPGLPKRSSTDLRGF